VADPAKLDVNENVVLAQVAAFERKRSERRSLAGGGVPFGPQRNQFTCLGHDDSFEK
jgi:hypothetical protein